MNGDDDETIQFYRSEATVYVASWPNDVSRHISPFLDRLTPGATIIELGCGGGRDAAYMIERGFDVDPTDGVAEMAKIAEEWLNRRVRVMSFDALCAVTAYDAVIASATLLHVPRMALLSIVEKIWNALKPMGLHVATFKSGNVEGRDVHGRYYNYPSREGLDEVYRKAGPWHQIEIEEYEDGGYFSAKGPWLKIIAQKSSIW